MASGRQAISAYSVYHFFWNAADWIFPPTCGGCDKPLTRWCDDCQSQVQRISGRICHRCGVPTRHGNLCARCRTSPPAFDQLRSWALFTGPIREAVHRLKYKRDLGLAEPLCLRLADYLQELNWSFDLLVNVPLSAKRLRERGYNQSMELFRPLGYMLHVPITSKAIMRLRDTRSQVGLTAKERFANVNNAFTAIPKLVYGKSVLLVDDVATTGATLNACAAAMLTAGAAHVNAFTLARAARVEDHTDETTSSNQQVERTDF